MGVQKKDPQLRTSFEPFRVTSELMPRVSKPTKPRSLHDLPGVRGDDLIDDVLDGSQSPLVQAQHKLSSAMVVLEWCLATQ
jgi:ornithine carbamoyltransferase